MKSIRYIQHLVIVIILLSISIGSGMASANPQNTLQLNVIQSDEQETILELVVNGFTSETFIQDGHTYQRIIIDKTVQSMDVGIPQVPIFSTMIGLANPDDISLQVVEKQSETYGGYELPYISGISAQGSNLLDQNVAVQVVSTAASELEIYGKILPEHPAEISQSGYLRDQGFAQITFYPVQYDAEHQEIVLNKRTVVKVTSNSKNNMVVNNTSWNRPEFETTLKNSLVNYSELIRPTPGTKEARLPTLQDQSTSASNPSLKITIAQEGLYQLTYDDLLNKGFNPSSIDSTTLKLTNRGSEVAILVQDGGDGKIDSGDRILFFGEALNDVYTNKNVYWLTYSPGDGKRMVEQNGTPGEAVTPDKFQNLLHAEQDTEYWQFIPEGKGQDHWFWGGKLSPITQDLPSTITYTVVMENIASASGLNANLHFVLKGASNDRTYSPDHHTRVYINDKPIYDWYWNSYDILDVNQDIPQPEFLVPGNNVVKFETIVVPDVIVDLMYVNWFELTYWDTYRAENNQLYFYAPTSGDYKFEIRGFTDPLIHVFDITDPKNVITFINQITLPDGDTTMVEFQDTALASDRYLAISERQLLSPTSIELDVASSWRTPDHAADYILITYDGFYDNVQPLADFRTSQGLRVEIVNVQDLYDEFNYGIFNPSAIRDFLIYAYEWWQSPAPLYVVLVGDAYQDYKDNYHTGSINYVPTQIVETIALGETPTDNWFVQIVGNDILPDMFIGRLSTQSKDQVDTIVQKIIHYEQDEDPLSWGKDALFVADDDEAMFETDSDGFADLLPPWYSIQKIYVGNYPPGDPTQDIINSINSGSMMVNYLGHGGVSQWGFWNKENQEIILDNGDVNLLTNADRHTFVTIESCLNGFFPGKQSTYSLAEALQRHNNGGAVAVWAPSGLSFSNGHQLLISGLYEAFFPLGIYGLGEATTYAKWNIYAQSSVWGDLVNAYILFGDPATELGAPSIPNLHYLPVIVKSP